MNSGHVGKQYLQSIQARTKWQSQKRNTNVGDIVLVLQDECSQSVAHRRMIHVFKDSNGYEISVKLRIEKVKNSIVT